VVFVFNFFVIFISFQKSHLVFKSYKLIKKVKKKRNNRPPSTIHRARLFSAHRRRSPPSLAGGGAVAPYPRCVRRAAGAGM
jgi:hypothetical protein